MRGLIPLSLLLVSVLFLLVSAGCSDSDFVAPDGYVTFEDEDGRFSLARPDEWVELPDVVMSSSALAVFAEPEDIGLGRANFLVTSEKLEKEMDAVSYLAKSREDMKKFIPRVEFLTEARETINGNDAVRFTYSIPVQETTMTLVAFAVIKDRMAYVLTGGAASERFAAYESVYDVAGRSLVIH